MLSEDTIASIVDSVTERFGARDGMAQAPVAVETQAVPRPALTHVRTKHAGQSSLRDAGMGAFATVDAAVLAATAAYASVGAGGLALRQAMVAAMRRAGYAAVDSLARDAVAETRLGRIDQKILKNRLVLDKTPGPEILTCQAQSGDHGLMLEEYAPYGVIGAITPTTNPTETILCNAIGMIAAGNAVVFNCHPSAKNVSVRTIDLLNRAIVEAGGPANLLTCVAEPTLASAEALMAHAGIRLLVVTGGPGVVKAALASGKKVIAGGPGNPPVFVDESADLNQAAAGIVAGVSLDNNILCTAEKEIIVHAAIADALIHSLEQNHAYRLRSHELARMERLLLQDGQMQKKWVGQDARVLLSEIGITPPAGVLMAFAEVPESHPFVQKELLTPIVGLFRVADAQEGIAAAVRCEQGNGHTAAMYSKNIDNLHQMARAVNTSIFTKNAPTFAGLGMGGEGYTSFTIASPTGEGLTHAGHFSRKRRCVLKDHFRIV